MLLSARIWLDGDRQTIDDVRRVRPDGEAKPPAGEVSEKRHRSYRRTSFISGFLTLFNTAEQQAAYDSHPGARSILRPIATETIGQSAKVNNDRDASRGEGELLFIHEITDEGFEDPPFDQGEDDGGVDQ
jgi:hypothetical protein